MDLYRITFEYKEVNNISWHGRFSKGGLYTLEQLPEEMERMKKTGLYKNIVPVFACKIEGKKEGS